MWQEYYTVSWYNLKPLSAPIWGMCFVLTGLYFLRLTWKEYQEAKQKVENPSKSPFIPISLWLGFALLWTLGVGAEVAHRYFAPVLAYENRNYKEVEGMIDHIETQYNSRQGSYTDIITVKGILFKYSDTWDVNSFSKPKTSGGQLDSGKYVKIYYTDDYILKIWLKN